MPTYEEVQERIRTRPRTWLVTGVAGFIGSNLLESLLKLNQQVVGLDNLSTGSRSNLTQVEDAVGKAKRLLGYRPLWRTSQGLAQAIDWYVAKLAPQRSTRVWAAGSRVVLDEL